MLLLMLLAGWVALHPMVLSATLSRDRSVGGFYTTTTAEAHETAETQQQHARRVKSASPSLHHHLLAQRKWLKCPDWIEKYAADHKELLRHAAEAKFILHTCGGENGDLCAGTGDRIRAMLETVRLAQYSGRAVLFTWASPEALETVLEPNAIDWRVKPTYKLVYKPGQSASYAWSTWKPWSNSSRDPPEIVDGSFADNPARLITISTNFMDQGTYLPGPPLGRLESGDRSCLFHALFKPSEELVDRTLEMRRCSPYYLTCHTLKRKRLCSFRPRQLFGSEDAPFLAVHLRMGGFEGERRTIERFNQYHGLMAALTCARDLAVANGITSPMLLLTDNKLLRDHVRAGLFKGFVTTPFDASHIAASDSGRLSLMSSFIDLALLSNAKCLIGSPSGFSTVAQIWGRHKCYISIEQCIAVYIKSP